MMRVGIGYNLPSLPKFKAKKNAPLEEAVAYKAVATFCTHPRLLTEFA